MKMKLGTTVLAVAGVGLVCGGLYYTQLAETGEPVALEAPIAEAPVIDTELSAKGESTLPDTE